MRSAVALATVAVLLSGGCVLVTGSTDGYSAIDAGSDGACAEGSCTMLACVSAADCGDGGAVCCLASPTRASTTCQTTCTGPVPVQLCRANAECGGTAGCIKQLCSAGGQTAELQACGTISGCTAAP